MGNSSDPLVVMTDDLARIIERFIAQHKVEHEEDGGFGGQIRIGAQSYLREWANVTETHLYRILKRKSNWTTLAVAERILGAIGQEHCFQNGECPVVPNPHWNSGHWRAYMVSRGCDPDDVL